MNKILILASISLVFLESCSSDKKVELKNSDSTELKKEKTVQKIINPITGLELQIKEGIQKSEESYFIVSKAIDGDEKMKYVIVRIDNVLVDSLKIQESNLIKMVSNFLIYSKSSCEYPLTYVFPEDAHISFYDGKIIGFLNGSCKNGYGVPVRMYTMIKFTAEGDIKKNKSGFFQISNT